MSAPTPHIAAAKGDFAKTVLMPGDPKRATFLAEHYFDKAVQVNSVRGMNGYTGFYKGKRISVMASGMGVPSMGIYSYELFHFFDVQSVIRIGSAGMLQESLRLRDILIAQGACTDSHFGAQFGLPGSFAPLADFQLLQKAVQVAQTKGFAHVVGNVLTTDVFYGELEFLRKWRTMGVLGVEMECAALYMNAARAGKQALCLCTVSDDPFTGLGCTAQEREQSFTQMIEIALEIAE